MSSLSKFGSGPRRGNLAGAAAGVNPQIEAEEPAQLRDPFDVAERVAALCALAKRGQLVGRGRLVDEGRPPALAGGGGLGKRFVDSQRIEERAGTSEPMGAEAAPWVIADRCDHPGAEGVGLDVTEHG